MWWVLLNLILLNIHQCFVTGTKHKFRRFGMGIYSTSCSSSKSDSFYPLARLLNPSTTEADDYMLNGDESSKYRVLLVSRVVVGNPHKRRRNATNMMEPPCGHHSVGFVQCWCYQAIMLISSPRSLVNLEWTSTTKRQLYTTMTPYGLPSSLFMGMLLRRSGPSCNHWH